MNETLIFRFSTSLKEQSGYSATAQCSGAFTQVHHQQAPQRRVEGGPAPHVAQVGLVVDAQEGEVLALTDRQTDGF